MTALKLKPIFRLQWEPAQNAHVLLYPEGMVKLNQRRFARVDEHKNCVSVNGIT
jgi:coenzyme PQQ biosynthesis protein PqqD